MSKKYKIQFDVPSRSITGEEIVDEAGNMVQLGRILADHIATASAEKQVIKLYGWATAMAKGKELELDLEDISALKQFVELLPRLTLLIKAQCLELLAEAKIEAA